MDINNSRMPLASSQRAIMVGKQLKVMNRWNKILPLAGVVAACLMVNDAMAQNGGGGGGGGRRNFDPAQFRQMILDNAKTSLEVTNDDEWNVLSAAIGKVMDAQQAVRSSTINGFRGGRNRGGQNGGGGGGQGGGGRRGGFGGPPSPEIEALQNAIDNKAPADEIKDKLAKLREVQKADEAKLEAAQADLQKLLTPRQEASAVLLGLLK
jgi:hypothetical protein